MFWFLPGLRNVIEYILLMPYRVLCALTGGGYYEEAWRKVLEILLKEYTQREREALQVSRIRTLERLKLLLHCMVLLDFTLLDSLFFGFPLAKVVDST